MEVLLPEHSGTVLFIAVSVYYMPVWSVLTNEFQALIYVVDSSDVERIAESKEELDAILNDPDMTGPF